MPKKKTDKNSGKGFYFEKEKKVIFFSTGCTVLDRVLGRGAAENRVINIIGDTSTGKTALLNELFANFYLKYKNGKNHYHEGEAAYDHEYARESGFLVDELDWVADENGKRIKTVEGWIGKMYEIIKEPGPHLYGLDSLDSLSSAEELDDIVSSNMQGARKANRMSELFRRMVDNLSQHDMTLVIVSQLRDKIVSFGRNWTCNGGRALSYYSSQRLMLKEVKKIERTVGKVQRKVGLLVKACCIKNKVAPDYRECIFPLLNGWGIDNAWTNINWLRSVGREEILDEFNLDPKGKIMGLSKKINFDWDDKEKKAFDTRVIKVWDEVEESFKLPGSKYNFKR